MNNNYQSGISIIMPAYNCEKFIKESILSVLNQTYEDWNLIIIDDCSKDNTVKIIENNYLKDERITLIKLSENMGAAYARNIGLQHAKSRYIAFLDSDDVWHQNKLLKQLNFMEHDNVKISCTYYGKIDENGNISSRIIKNRREFNYSVLLKEPPGNSSVMYDSKFVGFIQIPNIRKRNDYVMWLQIIKEGYTFHTIEEVLMYHRIRQNSLSKNKLSLIKYHWHIYRSIEKLSFIKSTNLLLYWGIKTIFCKFKK